MAEILGNGRLAYSALRAAKLGRAWRIQEEDLNAFIEDAKKEGLKSPD